MPRYEDNPRKDVTKTYIFGDIMGNQNCPPPQKKKKNIPRH